MTKELIRLLKNAGIAKIKKENEEPFTLKSGKKSRLFIDIKEACLNPKILKEIIYIITWNLKEGKWKHIKFDVIGSVAIGGIPAASVYEYISGIPHIIVRSEKHDRGTETQIIGDDKEGNLKGKHVLLIEDVATTGGSIFKAVNAIRDAGATCNDCIVIVDREEGAQKLCSEHSLKLYSILKKSDFGINEQSSERYEKRNKQ